MERKSVVIIGAGLGGLFTGAILAKEGFRVTILEKNATIGGGLQSFRRFGETFDTGMHVIGGMHEGGNTRRICEYLGIMDKVEVRSTDVNCSSKIFFGDSAAVYSVPIGRNNFINSLTSYFPHEKEGIVRYVDAIYAIADKIDLFNLRQASSLFTDYPPDFLTAADSFIAKYVDDNELRSLLAYMNPLYGGRGNETPAYVHAIINVLYINGTCRFEGGSDKFANLLAEVVMDNGGEVLVNEKVEWIDISDKVVRSVHTVSKRIFRADIFISDIHPCALLNLMPQDVFPRLYRTRLQEIPNSYSAFCLYIKLKSGTFPYMNYSEYYIEHSNEIWKFGEADGDWPKGFLLMTPPDGDADKYATKLLVTAPMLFDTVRRWEHTSVGCRGKEYVEWKQLCAEKIIGMIERIHPGFRDCIENMNMSSPLTIRDFYGVKEGAITGYSKDCNNIIVSQIPVVTKVKNLLLTGQNINLHGFCGVALTAISTCEVLLGHNYIINKINTRKE